MSVWISNAAVFLAVLLAMAYSVWRLGPRTLRMWLKRQLARVLPIQVENETSGACDACGGCKPEPKASPLRFVPPTRLRR
jgi:hypothetical protein